MASIYKRGKVWAYKVYYQDHGKQKAVSQSGFKTKAEAKDASILRENELLQGKDFAKERMTLSDYMLYWKKLYKDDTISVGSSKQIETIIKVLKKQYNPMMKNINHENYQQFLNYLSSIRTKATVKKYHSYIKACIRHAIQTRIILIDPTLGVVLKGKDAKEDNMKFLSLDEFRRLEAAVLDGIDTSMTSRYIILTSMYTGARFGECLGLTWDCIDFEKEQIHIEKGFDYLHTNKYTDGKTKNANRIIDVPRKLLDILDTLPRDSSSVFERVSNNGVNHSLTHALKRAKIDKMVTFHALRHTHASILLSQGVQLLTISRRLGHSDANITLKTYSHILDEMKISEAKKIKEILVHGTNTEQNL